MSSRKLSARNYNYLRVLRSCLLADDGWEWRGTRAWMFADEFPHTMTVLAAADLPALADSHLVDREDVSDPFQRRPHNLYRITQPGIDLLAEREREQCATPGSDEIEPSPVLGAASIYEGEPVIVPVPAGSRSPVERDTIFIARCQWNGLAFLQAQTPERWWTVGDVRNAVGRFYPNDAYLLARKALVDVTTPDAGGERQYRVTMLGRGARLRCSDSDQRLAMVHIPGIRAAATSGRGNAAVPHGELRFVGLRTVAR